LMADRLSNFEIGRRLGISIHTARRHSERVLSKLEIHSRNDVRAALTDADYAPALRYGQRKIA
ncbi:MAG: LuxR C-terminal-related transcriptional regulator, partial [Gemmatimonadota bacterium]